MPYIINCKYQVVQAYEQKCYNKTMGVISDPLLRTAHQLQLSTSNVCSWAKQADQIKMNLRHGMQRGGHK